MKTITLVIPDGLTHPADASDEDDARNARLALAISGTTRAWYAGSHNSSTHSRALS